MINTISSANPSEALISQRLDCALRRLYLASEASEAAAIAEASSPELEPEIDFSPEPQDADEDEDQRVESHPPADPA